MAQLRLLFFSAPATAFSRDSISFAASSPSSLPLLSRSASPSLRRFPFLHSICCASPSALTLIAEDQPSLESEIEDEFSNTRLLAQNIPWSSTADDIRALFQNHGKVIDVELSMHSRTRNRGLAFVEMGSPEEATEALNKLEASEFEGRTLKLNYAKPKKKQQPPAAQPKLPITFNLFVANLAFSVTTKDLKDLFSSTGNQVVSAEVIFRDNPRRSSGFGFVSFATKKEAEAAISTFDGKEFMGREIQVAYSKQFVKVQKDVDSNAEEPEQERT